MEGLFDFCSAIAAADLDGNGQKDTIGFTGYGLQALDAIANAYDALHLAARAIENAGSTDGKAVRDGFYAIREYDGLIKHYQQPFTPLKHDALGPDDYVFTHFVNDRIVPLTPEE